MLLQFEKYHGAGNDFIMIDGREDLPILTESVVHFLCQRHFGIGADGLIILEPSENQEFYMRYYNADGALGSLCGNGSRCAVAFAQRLGIIDKECVFEAYDGLHRAHIESQDEIRIEMADQAKVESCLDGFFIDTGSPHFVRFVEDLDDFDVEGKGDAYRWHQQFKPGGTNANFIEPRSDSCDIRTFERGVEAETMACGTGIVASALVMASLDPQTDIDLDYLFLAKGGELRVKLRKEGEQFTNIWLCGPAKMVFSGSIWI